MRYPRSPKALLIRIASRGAGTTRLAALRLAEAAPDQWPPCPRGSYAAALRALACSKKSIRVRLAALRALLGILTLREQEYLEGEKRQEPGPRSRSVPHVSSSCSSSPSSTTITKEI